MGVQKLSGWVLMLVMESSHFFLGEMVFLVMIRGQA